jgi:hypothetical protein
MGVFLALAHLDFPYKEEEVQLDPEGNLFLVGIITHKLISPLSLRNLC